MKIVQWDMKEKFVFPAEAGMPTGAEAVNVTPMFTINRTDDAVRLNGIYHIAANIMLDEAQTRKEIGESAVLINDVEIDDKMGYFEYAVPFNIDLPAEASDPLDVTADNTLFKVDEEGFFAITWDVDCVYQEPVAVKEEVLETDKEVVKEVVKEVKEAIKVAKEAIKEHKEVTKEVISEQVVIEKDEPRVTKPVEVVAKVTEKAQAAKVIEVEQPKTEIVLLDSTSFNDMDEVLSFIEGLEDGISATLFRSNDILMQGKT